MDNDKPPVKILIIDDESAIRMSFAYYLEDLDFIVLTAENGRVGLDMIKEEQPDLVLSDLRMPEMDGFEVLKFCKELAPDLPKIVISGANRIDDVVEALRLGAWDYLVKPVKDLSILGHSVDKALERARLRRENFAYQEHLLNLVSERTRELEQSRQALREYSEKLEKTVGERTAELRLANEELNIAKMDAESANKAKSEFLANMSHEIRTPMNGVIAAADLALGEHIGPKVKSYLNIIQSSGYALLGIINDILDFSKIEADKLELESIPFDLMDVITNVIDLFVSKTVEKKIELLIDISPDLPKSCIGDPLRLQQILTNLVGNAVKFTDNGGVITVGVDIGDEKGSDCDSEGENPVRLDFVVKDTGIGMKPEYVDKLFIPFTQADLATTRKFGGSGLGLTICKRLVEMMNGEIHVQSKEGRGSEFEFTVCLRKNTTAPLVDITKVMKELAGLTVLIVDDCADFRITTEKILQTVGLKIRTAALGEDALVCLGKKDFHTDLIILDWLMPEINGIELAARIRRELKLDTPIILTTSFGSNFKMEDAQKAGVDTCLIKPVGPGTWIETIFKVLGKKQLADSGSRLKQSVNDSNAEKKLSGKRVLVAEDNLTNQALARAILTGVGLDVTIADNGKKALQALEKENFDAVLMDIQMPEMDGYEATRMIRQDPRFNNLPVIAMTANAIKGDEEKCLKAGMDGYVSKPVNRKVLFRVLSEMIHPETGKGG